MVVHLAATMLLLASTWFAQGNSSSAPAPAAPDRLDGQIELPDGVALSHTVIHFDESQPRPVLMVRTPYRRQLAVDGARRFTRQGFCVFLQDCRGTGESQGEFVPFLHEADDGAFTLDWVKDQQWCDGTVATWGMSYLGITQWQLAPLVGDSLRAMVLSFTGSDCYRDLIHFGGVQSLAIGLSWSLSMAGQPGFPRYKHLPLVEADDQSGKDVATWNDWTRHSALDEYWKPIDFAGKYGEVEAPALLVAGWYDLFQPGQIEDYVHLSRRQGPIENTFARLIVGPWDHTGPGPVQGRPDLGPNAYLSLNDEEDQFLARFALGIANGYEARKGVRAFFLGENLWHELDGWPPGTAEPLTFFLHSLGHAADDPGDGVLTKKPARQTEEPDAFTYDPSDPTPSYAENLWTPLSSLSDLSQIARRPEVLVYTTLPLTEDLRIAGPVDARLFIHSDAPDTDFAVMLVDVAPDGTCHWRGEGIQRAGMRDSEYLRSAPLSEKPVEIKVRMGHMACTFAKGHRVRVHVTSSNFPRFARNLNTATESGLASEPRIARNAVHHSSEQPSSIRVFRMPAQ